MLIRRSHQRVLKKSRPSPAIFLSMQDFTSSSLRGERPHLDENALAESPLRLNFFSGCF